jgi:hypothetical protein
MNAWEPEYFTHLDQISGREFAPSQGLHEAQQHKKEDIHALLGIRTSDISVRTTQLSSSFRPLDPMLQHPMLFIPHYTIYNTNFGKW